MNTNTAAASFAADLAPYFAKNIALGLTPEQALEASVIQWKDDEDRAFSRRLGLIHLLGGTYDEFRAEAA